MRKIMTLLLLPLMVSQSYAVEKERPSSNDPCCQSTLSKDGNLNTPSENKGMFAHIMPKLLYSYTSFKFNSERSELQDTVSRGLIVRNIYNRFSGNTKQYTAGVDGVKLLNKVMAGLSVMNLKTELNSVVSLLPATPVAQAQLINNTTLFGHILKEFNSHFAIDVAAAYGRSRISSNSTIFPAEVPPPLFPVPEGNTYTGFYTNESTNRLFGINALVTQPWKKFLFRGMVGGLYNQVHSGYALNTFVPTAVDPIPPQEILPLTNKVIWINEGVEASYKLTDSFTPFVNLGLIQVAHYSNSRAALPSTVISPLPQLELNQNAYRVGGGIAFNSKSFSIRLDQRYYNSVGTFISNQTTLAIAFYPD